MILHFNPEVLYNPDGTCFIELFREEKRRYETGGERTDAILL